MSHNLMSCPRESSWSSWQHHGDYNIITQPLHTRKTRDKTGKQKKTNEMHTHNIERKRKEKKTFETNKINSGLNYRFNWFFSKTSREGDFFLRSRGHGSPSPFVIGARRVSSCTSPASSTSFFIEHGKTIKFINWRVGSIFLIHLN